MASIATENVKLGEEQRSQESREKEVRLSGEQELHRKRSAQNVLKLLQVAAKEGEVPGTEAISDACLKAEALILEQAQSPSIDSETRKLLEDIAQLAGSVKQVVRHNDLGDRLNRISEELKKAIAASHISAPSVGGVAEAGAEASKQAIAFVEAWRPLFSLITRDKNFRLLIVDALNISRRVYGRHTEGISSYVEEKFLEGKSPVDIAKKVGKDVKEGAQNEEGQVELAITDQELEQLQDELFRVLRKLSAQPKYHEGVQSLFNLLDFGRKQFKTSTDPNNATAELHARRAQLETQELMASIAGKDALYIWIDSLQNLINKIEEDEHSLNYLSEVKEFILLTKDADNVSKEDYKQKGRDLVNRGRELVNRIKYRNEVDEFFNKSNDLIENIRNNETLTVLSHHAGIVASDISFLDQDGKVQLNLELIARLRDIVMPSLAETIKYIPLPRIQDSDEKREYWIDNIVLCGYDIIPENIRFQIESDSKISLRDTKTQHSDTRLVITLAKIRTELRDLEFFYHKKTFPELTEQGRAHVKLGGDGATLKIVFEINQEGDAKFAKLSEGYADFHISKMDIEFEKKTLTHDVLVPLMTTMWNQQIQSAIEDSVEKNLTSLIHNLADKLTSTLAAVNKPFHVGVKTVQDVLGTKEFSTAYQNRIQKLE